MVYVMDSMWNFLKMHTHTHTHTHTHSHMVNEQRERTVTTKDVFVIVY